jgi:hypothetical protein
VDTHGFIDSSEPFDQMARAWREDWKMGDELCGKLIVDQLRGQQEGNCPCDLSPKESMTERMECEGICTLQPLTEEVHSRGVSQCPGEQDGHSSIFFQRYLELCSHRVTWPY